MGEPSHGSTYRCSGGKLGERIFFRCPLRV
jgi:hypothetical protein